MQKSLKILVAEHDRDVAEGLSDILELAGHEIHRAFTVETACEELRLHDFDVAFINVKIEGLSRLESFAKVREIKPDAKLIMMSAHTIDQLTAEVADGARVKAIVAPFDIESIVESLESVVPAGTLLLEEVPAGFAGTLQAALKERSIAVAIATNRDEALARLAEAGGDVLLLDLGMTAIRSLEVFLELKRQGCALPTILFRSYAEDGPAHNDITRSDILFKPFDPGQMVKLLESMAAGQDTPAEAAPVEAAPPFGETTPTPAEAEAPEPPPEVPPQSTEAPQPFAETAPEPVPAPPDPGDPQGTAEEILIWKEAAPPPAIALDPAEPPAAAAPAEDPPPVQEQAPALQDVPLAAPEDLAPVVETPEQAPAVQGVPRAAPEDLASVIETPVQEQAPAVPEVPRAAPEEPTPVADAPAEVPAVGPVDAGPAEPAPDEASNETQLPAGIGISTDQLEQAASEIGQTAPPSAEAAPAAAPEPLRVMVVDDDHDMAEGLAEILDDTGLNVRVAHSTEQAKAVLQDFEAQIALVDIQLGRNSGLDLIGDLKLLRPGIIVVMVTAQAEQQMAIDALRKGAFDYLNKPLHPEELLAAMDRCFDDLAKRAAQAAEPQAPLPSPAVSKAESAEYLAKLSEKLKTPHEAVTGLSQTLSEEMLGASQFVDHSQAIREASERLADVVAAFADIDQVAGGKLELNESAVDLTRVIFRCLEIVRPAADAGELTVEIEFAEIPVFVIGDRHKLTQMVLCLLTNAVKFTPKQGSIQFIQSRAEDNGLIIEVKDSGIGVAAPDLAQVLAPVVDNEGALDPAYQGSGLGLPLAASMAALHGAALSLDSAPGQGTTATLHLPPERNIAPKRLVAI